MDLSLILPAHNEAGALRDLLPATRRVLDDMAIDYEVILVDDGSTDDTADLLAPLVEAWPRLRVEIHRRNCGQTAALSTGIAGSHGDIVVTMDADGQSVPEDIPALVSMLTKDRKLQMIAGCRRSRQDSWFRLVPSAVANLLIRLVSGTSISDTGCGLKAFRGEYIRSVPLSHDAHRLLPVMLAMDGANYAVVDVQHRPRIHGIPHYGLERTFGVLLDIIALRFTSRKARPYHALGLVGLLGVVVSFLLCAYILYEKYAWGIWVHRNPLLLIAVVILLGGLQIIVLGLICEIFAVQLIRLTDERRRT